MALLAGVFHNPPVGKYTIRVALVGTIGILLDLAFFSVFRVEMDAPALITNTLSYTIGVINSFVGHSST